MITFQHIQKRFGKLQVLNDINIQFRQGQCIALIGPNGCGKTTLIKSLLGMVIPDSGDILVDNKNIKNAFEYRDIIGYMPQIGRYPENMTIGQIIAMVKDIRQQKDLDEELYNAFDIASLEDKKMSTLSGGTTQKVSATIAFLFNPKILILDEPTAGLDPISAEILKEKIIKERNNGKLILITSHLLNELNDIITDVIFMQDGKIIFQQSLEDLLKETDTATLSKAITNILKSQQQNG